MQDGATGHTRNIAVSHSMMSDLCSGHIINLVWYKLALLRTLCRVADGSAGFARESGNDFVSLPLGLIALTWLRLFKPLLSAGLPQNPKNIGLNHLSFVKPAYLKLINVSHLDLRVGMKFSGDEGHHLHQALKDAAVTIQEMPATHITYQKGEPVLPVTKESHINPPSNVHLDEAYLASFGEMRVPRNLWRTLQSHSAWVEPTIISEWQRHIRAYAARQDIVIEEPALGAAMTWGDPIRDVGTARDRAKHAVAERQLFCVWSGKKLNSQNLDIDHCVPWTVWPCGDLWNLMPTHRTVNQNEKRALLPSDKLLRSAEERVFDWWGSAYVHAKPTISERFWTEAKSSLPTVATTETQLGDVLDAVLIQMLRLRHDQQVPVWSGDKYL